MSIDALFETLPMIENFEIKPSIEIEFRELPNYPNMTITSCGDENLYFTHNDKNYFCKCL